MQDIVQHRRVERKDKERTKEHVILLLNVPLHCNVGPIYMNDHITTHLLVGVTSMWKGNGWRSTNRYIYNRIYVLLYY